MNGTQQPGSSRAAGQRRAAAGQPGSRAEEGSTPVFLGFGLGSCAPTLFQIVFRSKRALIGLIAPLGKNKKGGGEGRSKKVESVVRM